MLNRVLNVLTPALSPWLKIPRDWLVYGLASVAIASALRGHAIASLVHAHRQSWVNAQMLVASVWRSVKNTQVKIQLAKHGADACRECIKHCEDAKK